MKRSSVLAALVLTATACAGGNKHAQDGTIDPETDAQQEVPDEDGGLTVDDPDATGVEPSQPVPPGMVVEAPVIDADGLPAAPAFTQPIKYQARPGSVTLYLPEVAGAGDYRVFALTDGVKVTANGGNEHVEGAVISCAGLVQHGQCDPAEAMTQYGPNIRVEPCGTDVRAIQVKKRVLRQVNLDGLSGRTKVVVEAIDGLCPFPGAFGSRHHDVTCKYDNKPMLDATFNGKPVSWRAGPPSVPIRTEAEIRADYGSLILNGQWPAQVTPSATVSAWEKIGLPAAARDPKVLQRVVVEVEPSDPAALPEGFDADDFYESFSDPADQPQAVSGAQKNISNVVAQTPLQWQMKQMALYSYGADGAQMFLAQGTLRSVIADIGGGIMSSAVAYPNRAFAVPDAADSYVHATFEVPPNASQRRYWWFHACGAAAAGQTMVNGKLPEGGAIIPMPGFMNPIEGVSVSSKGWNCLQIVPRGGEFVGVAGGPYTNSLGGGRPETDLRIVINKPIANPSNMQQITGTAINVSPAQHKDARAGYDGTWLRQWDASKKISGVMLDDQMFLEQRVKFDVFFNRGRIVVFANGVQKLCNDFPKQRLTMAEAAIGVGHVLYHSSADRQDYLRRDWLRTGQYQYIHNLSFVDQRNFDNIGVRQGVGLPANFEAGQCYSAP